MYPDTTDATRLIPAATYLSGNVRRTLAAAETAAQVDPVYAGNVEALRAVLPRTIEAGEIGLRPGVPWIPGTDYAAFVTEVLAARDVSVDYTQGTWTIEVPKWQCGSPLMTDVYGTGAVDAVSLLESVCNAKPIQVRRSKAEVERTGGNPVDMPATFAAQVLMPNQEQLDAMLGSTRAQRFAAETRNRTRGAEPGTYRPPPPSPEPGRER